ncbi:putative disease resistance RPP13-like protein 1 [Morella rubra]|uniref:Putative disease resistance RPP13-like protein 1 n=1 Tax=Morella rubra TaxID=262757 RepID=A0A6A1UPR9_9ROSI|nr:putative disease resistance RPP13-like protein 1 [Morella rubra]
MGGVGKTSLAQLVYNDKKVEDIFDVKAWVCVSEDFDVVRVTKAVLESVGTSENCDGKDLNWLQVKLKEKVQGKKFLVIMDDVWNENYEGWTKLRAPFEAGAPGSRILVTTRNHGVSSMMGTLNALDARDFSAFPDLKDIGEDIVKKCKGLPLAATTIGGLLRTRRGPDEWKEVLHSRIWGTTEEGSGIIPALMLSYHHLPSHLKRCFAYCSIFPKGYEFESNNYSIMDG